MLQTKRHPGSKIHTFSTAIREIATWRATGQCVVFTNGCFDLVHPGHAQGLHAASQHGRRLVVGVNGDASVTALKGAGRPIYPLLDRLFMLACLEFVDVVFPLRDCKDVAKFMELSRPNVLVKCETSGPRPYTGEEFILQSGGRVITIPPEKPYSTTEIISLLRGANNGQ